MNEVTGVSHEYVRANGITFHVARAGRGEPVVLLHGWPQHWYMWRYQIPRLAERYAVYAPDLRGFGWSDAPGGGYEKESHVDDMLALMDALGLRRVRLAGHDWGGWIGFLLCLREPARFEKYVALNVTHPFPKKGAATIEYLRFWYQLVIASPVLGQFLIQKTDMVPRLLRNAATTPRSDADIEAFAERLREGARARASVAMYRTFLTREVFPILRGRYHHARLSIPTLLYFGECDGAISTRLLGGYEGNADNMKVETVPQAGHFIAEDVPDLVTDRMLAFFA